MARSQKQQHTINHGEISFALVSVGVEDVEILERRQGCTVVLCGRQDKLLMGSNLSKERNKKRS
jgi:hypothetical protein